MKFGQSKGLLALVVAGVLALAGCASSGGAKAGSSESTQAGAQAPAATGEATEGTTAGQPSSTTDMDPLKNDVRFGFDEAILTSEDRALLKKDASILKVHSTVKVVIAGHADERGTDAYNLVLGQRRAKAARIYLIRLGVASRRIKIRSFGSREIPGYSICSDHNEGCWAQHRVAHFMKITM